MANQNTVAGVYQLPKMIISDTNEHALVVPGPTPPSGVSWGATYFETSLPNNGPNPFPGFPTPQFPVNSGLSVGFPVDVAGSLGADGHVFKIKLVAVAGNPGGGNLTVKLYQVANSQLGVIGAAGSVTTAGAPGTGATTMLSAGKALTTPPSTGTAFFLEFLAVWDSSSQILQSQLIDGYYTSTSTGTILAQGAWTNLTSITGINQLNFMPSFTFATSNAANYVCVQEFAIERY